MRTISILLVLSSIMQVRAATMSSNITISGNITWEIVTNTVTIDDLKQSTQHCRISKQHVTCRMMDEINENMHDLYVELATDPPNVIRPNMEGLSRQ